MQWKVAESMSMNLDRIPSHEDTWSEHNQARVPKVGLDYIVWVVGLEGQMEISRQPRLMLEPMITLLKLIMQAL